MPDINDLSLRSSLLKVLFVFLAAFALPVAMPAQNDNSSVVEAFESGDAAGLSTYFKQELWLCIDDFEESLSARDAFVRLNRFFNEHSVRGFESLHNGGSANQANEVVIGELITDKGDYRVYVYFTGGAEKQIDELRIEP